MKWNNKYHEYDKSAMHYEALYSLDKGVAIFGAGNIGEDVYWTLKKYKLLHHVIDNTKEGFFYEYRICSLIEFMEKREHELVIVCISNISSYFEIKKQLMETGLKEYEDFIWYEEYFLKIIPVLLFYNKNNLFIYNTQLSLTERCTLKCKKCAHGCHMVSSDREDLTIEFAKKSIDYFFNMIDYNQEFTLIGGETLLYNDLGEIVSYLGENYKHKIGMISIVTNGTIVPKNNLMEICRQYNVLFRISNYSVSIPSLRERYNKLTDILLENRIKYRIQKENLGWMDYGFDYLDRHGKGLERVFNSCLTQCHEIRGGRFYFCIMARSISENHKRFTNIKNEDYFEMHETSDVSEEMRKKFFEYTMGYSEKGYLDMCNYCNGAESYLYPIPAAEQVNAFIRNDKSG